MVDTSAPASRLDTDPRRAHVSLSKHPYQIGVFGSGTIGPKSTNWPIKSVPRSQSKATFSSVAG